MRFDVDRMEARGGRLVVSGYWSGVRGMRFVRPTLIVGEREVLATLDHKPWTPDDELAWTASFPWEDAAPDPREVSLAVAPSITVPLGSEPDPPAQEPEPGAEPEPEPEPQRLPAPDAEPAPARDPLRAEVETLTRQRNRLRAELEAAQRREQSRGEELDAARSGLREAEQRRDEARLALTTAERERDHAIAQRDEAAADREAAVRSRARMEAQLSEERERRVQAERQRDEARAQREEALLAHRTLQRRLDAALAARPAETVSAARFSRPRPEPHDDPDRPIGVRTIPATRAVAPDLHRAERGGAQPRVSLYDVWAIRILGSVAAICFIGFLVLLLRLVL